MKKSLKKLAAMLSAGILLTAAASFTTAYAADGTSYEYEGYVYDYWGNAQETPAAFDISFIIDSSTIPGEEFSSIDDVTTSRDGRIFVCDRLAGKVFVFSDRGEFLTSIKTIKSNEPGKLIATYEDGTQVKLINPTGAWYHEKQQELYIADSGTKQLFVLDGESYKLKKLIAAPENMTGVTEYIPSKVVVDKADRIYIVVAASYEGIVELNSDGTFSRYFGVNEPKINLVQYFWKSIATDTQKEKIGKTYAPGFTNLSLDSEGFIYAVTRETSASTKLFRLNTNGENVIRATGFPLTGDLLSRGTDESRFIDVSVTDYGVAAVLDETRGRIFLYDYDGLILNVFGGIGYSKGQFRKPTSICWLNDSLVISDTDLREVYVMNPTSFGKAALRASEEYYNGNWSEATDYFKECIKFNANYEVAYIGVGKNLLMQDEYEDAMYYFKLGNARDFYSKAYNGYRGEQIREHFWIIATVFVALVVLLIWSEVRYHKKLPKGGEQ